jgi:O-antigen/teichoic acid export membrane protein
MLSVLTYSGLRAGTLVIMFLGSLLLAHTLGSDQYGIYAQGLAFAGIVSTIGTLGQGELFLRDELSFTKLLRRTLVITALTAIATTLLGLILHAGSLPVLATLCVTGLLGTLMHTYWTALQRDSQDTRRAGSEVIFRAASQVGSNVGALIWHTPLAAAATALVMNAVPVARRLARPPRVTAPVERALRAGAPYALAGILSSSSYMLLPVVVAVAADETTNAGFRFVALAATGSRVITRAMSVELLQRPLFASTGDESGRILRHRLSANVPLAAAIAGAIALGGLFIDHVLPDGVPTLRNALLILAALPLLQVVSQALDVLVQTRRKHGLNNLKQVIVSGSALAFLLLWDVTVEAGALAFLLSEALGLLVYLVFMPRIRGAVADVTAVEPSANKVVEGREGHPHAGSRRDS